jgi:hypothetical protein
MTRQLEPTTAGTFGAKARLQARIVRSAGWLKRDRGAATAEYAVVSVAAAGLGGILIKLLTSDWFQEILKSILNLKTDPMNSLIWKVARNSG